MHHSVRFWGVAWLLVLGGVYAGVGAAGLDTAWGDWVTALGAGFAWTLAPIGAGAGLLSRFCPALLNDRRGALHALVLGWCVWGLLGFGLAAAGLVGPGSSTLVGVVLAAGWLLRPDLRLRLDNAWLWLAIAMVAIPGVIIAMAPPISTDELYYHLALPELMERHGGWVGGFLHPDGSRPLAFHLPLTMVLATGGVGAVKVVQVGLSVALLVGVAEVAEAHWDKAVGSMAVLLMAGSWSFAHEAGVVTNNVLAAIGCLAALDAALRGNWRVLSVAAGMALAVKYTSAGPLLGVFLVASLSWRQRISSGLAAVGLLSPWWIRNAVEGLHPLFPYVGWPGDLTFQYLERYGAGRSAMDFLMLPWNAIMTAEVDSYRFMGQLHPLFLGLIPIAILIGWRDLKVRSLVIATVIGCVFWALGPHWFRYLLPTLPVLALSAGVGASWLLARPKGGVMAFGALGLVGLMGLPANLGPMLLDTAKAWPVASGQVSDSVFLKEHVHDWPVIEWSNEHLPSDAKVALLFSWSGYLLERDRVLGSVEDHVPTRHWVTSHGEMSLSALRAQGVSHLVVGRAAFLPKSYPFLTEKQLSVEFWQPRDQLESLLLMEATLLFQHRHSRVFRLN